MVTPPYASWARCPGSYGYQASAKIHSGILQVESLDGPCAPARQGGQVDRRYLVEAEKQRHSRAGAAFDYQDFGVTPFNETQAKYLDFHPTTVFLRDSVSEQ